MNKISLIRSTAYLTFAVLASGLASVPVTAAVKDHGRYSDWDRDRDGFLRRYEFSNYIYDMADKNGNGVLDQKEWSLYTSSWYDPYRAKYQEFSYYDTDGDGFIENGEFNTSFYKTSLFDEWDYDSNGFVDPNEWRDAINTYESFAASHSETRPDE